MNIKDLNNLLLFFEKIIYINNYRDSENNYILEIINKYTKEIILAISVNKYIKNAENEACLALSHEFLLQGFYHFMNKPNPYRIHISEPPKSVLICDTFRR